jgi:AraC-like DNA-binding protein
MTENWSFAGTGGTVHHDFHAARRIEFGDGPISGFMEEIQIRPGLALYRLEGRSNCAFSIVGEEVKTNNMLILGCMLSGAGTIAADGNEHQNWREEGQIYALTTSDRSIAYHAQAERPWRAVALKLEPDALPLLAHDDVPAMARATLEKNVDPLSIIRPPNQGASRAAHDLMNPIYSGRMEVLYREAKVLELMAYQLDMIGPDAVRSHLSAREQARIRDARDRLVADLRSPPGLHALAVAVGLSPRRLNQGFRELYGTTVFDYLRDARLEAARRMLDEGFALPLKQLAWHIGYAQPTNFINAFRRRFGMSPGLYRQLQDEE